MSLKYHAIISGLIIIFLFFISIISFCVLKELISNLHNDFGVVGDT